MNSGSLPSYFLPAVICAVILGNLLTQLLLAGWQSYQRRRRTPLEEPIWGYFALLLGGAFAVGGMLGFIIGLAL